MSYVPVSSEEFDELRAGDLRLTLVLPNANATGHEVIDFRVLRPLALRGVEGWNPDVVRTIHGYDAAVIENSFLITALLSIPFWVLQLLATITAMQTKIVVISRTK